MGLFDNRIKTDDQKTQIPVWFMRQAGRYHNHYQNIKKNSDFMTMCKDSKLACEITMGPIDDFNFDAAILFSDLLFPLEQLGMGLSYHSGPPTLELHLETHKDFEKLKKLGEAKEFYDFQGKAVSLLKDRLPQEKTLLGFVGAPFTLYTYATQGSHGGNLTQAKLGLYDGRFSHFLELLLPELIENMAVQARGGADALCLFDTAAGELTFGDYKKFIIPEIRKITKAFKAQFPDKKIVYYSKFTHMNYLEAIEDDNIDVLGVDWRHDLKEVLGRFGKDYYIQGNLDPSYLFLPWNKLETKLQEFWNHMQGEKDLLHKWIMGLGHGVLPGTPEENVRNAVSFIHKNFRY